MTDKTAIEALKKICSIETGTWDNPVPFSKLYHEAKGVATEALASIEEEKPADSADAVACRIEEIQFLLNDGSVMAKRHAQMVQEIQSFAESYHAEQCKACDWNKNCDNCGWTETRTGYGCQNHEVTECMPGKRKGWKQNVYDETSHLL